MTITLLQERPMSWNKFYGGMHWSGRAEEVLRVHQLMWASIKQKPSGFKLSPPVAITITVYFKNRPQDCSNIAAKLYEDGLVLAKVIDNDGPKYVESMTTVSRVDRNNPRVEIEVKESGDSWDPQF